MTGGKQIGKVYLVGAGPGDPYLITVRGRELLGEATVVLYDGLVDERLLRWAPQARLVCVGKHGREKIWSQEEICQRLVEEARSGQIVVRLKGGDPAVFARTAEELEALVEAGIPFEVVPGVTAGLAAGSLVGIPITHRDHASAVALVTGHQCDRNSEEQPIDWAALVRFPGTLVVYMGVTTAKHWSRALMEAGKPGDTPVAVIRHCSWPDQQVIRTTLQELSEVLSSKCRIRPPAVVLIGDVAGVDPRWDWYDQLPLRGVGVLVTRPKPQGQELAERLERLGAATWIQPAISIGLPQETADVDRLVEIIAEHSRRTLAGDEVPGAGQGESALLEPLGLTFSSPSSVQVFWDYVFAQGYDARIASRCHIAVVGPATETALQQYGLRADWLPDASSDYSAAGLVKKLAGATDIRRWFVTCSNESRETLAEGLRALGKEVTLIKTYESRPVTQLDPLVERAIESGRIQFCTVTSSAIARATHSLLGPYRQRLFPVSFSPAISRQLHELNWPPVAEAASTTVESLIEAIQQAAQQWKARKSLQSFGREE